MFNDIKQEYRWNTAQLTFDKNIAEIMFNDIKQEYRW